MLGVLMSSRGGRQLGVELFPEEELLAGGGIVEVEYLVKRYGLFEGRDMSRCFCSLGTSGGYKLCL